MFILIKNIDKFQIFFKKISQIQKKIFKYNNLVLNFINKINKF